MTLLRYFIVVALIGYLALMAHSVLMEDPKPSSISVTFPAGPASQVHQVPETSTISFDNNPYAVHDMTFGSH